MLKYLHSPFAQLHSLLFLNPSIFQTFHHWYVFLFPHRITLSTMSTSAKENEVYLSKDIPDTDTHLLNLLLQLLLLLQVLSSLLLNCLVCALKVLLELLTLSLKDGHRWLLSLLAANTEHSKSALTLLALLLLLPLKTHLFLEVLLPLGKLDRDVSATELSQWSTNVLNLRQCESYKTEN